MEKRCKKVDQIVRIFFEFSFIIISSKQSNKILNDKVIKLVFHFTHKQLTYSHWLY